MKEKTQNNRAVFVSSLLKRAETTPDRIALVDRDGARRTSYASLVRGARCVAGFIRDRKFPKGTFIPVRMTSRMEYVCAELGIWLAGCVPVPMGMRYPAARVSYITEHCQSPLVLDLPVMEEILTGEPWEGCVPKADDGMLLIYTSGSTGTPKGVLHSFRTLEDMFPHTAEAFGFTEDTVFGSAAPLYFIACLNVFEVLHLGGTVHLYDRETAGNAGLLEQYNEEHDVSSAYLDPDILKLYHGTGLRTVITAGEKLTLPEPPEDCTVCNTYGMTEAGPVFVYKISGDVPEDIPIGRPISPVRYRIVTPDGRDAAPGERGELLLTGRHFCVEYYREPEKTRQLYEDGWLHTGDLVYEDEQGFIHYHSRKDWMVKINGQRVEIQEVEHHLGRIDGIREAAVRAFTDKQGKTRLVGYYTGEKKEPGSIRKELEKTLPVYMIPIFYVHLDTMPRSGSGKTDRMALKEPAAADYLTGYTAPRTAAQEKLCAVMAEVLGLERVGIRDDFFELGSDSVGCMSLVALLEEKHGLRISTRAVYEGRTPEEILERAAREERETENARQEGFSAKERPQKLLPVQTYYLDYQLASPHKRIANIPVVLRIPGVRPEVLAQAAEQVIRHFEIYSTVITFNLEGETVQCSRPELLRPVRIIRADAEEITDRIRREITRPMKLYNSLLYRCVVFEDGSDSILCLVMHHIIMDAASTINTIRCIFDAMEGKDLPSDWYYLYLQRQAEKREKPDQKAERSIRKLRGIWNGAQSRYPRPDRESRDNTEGVLDVELPCSYGEYKKAAVRRKASVAVLFTAAGLLALSRYNGVSRPGVEWLYNGRDEKWRENLVGPMLSAIPAAVDLALLPDTQALIDEVRRQAAEGIRFADYTNDSFLAGPGEGEYMKMVCQQSFTLPDNAPEGTRMHLAYENMEGTTTIFQCIFYPVADGEKPKIHLNYNASRYEEESVRRFGQMLVQAMEECRG